MSAVVFGNLLPTTRLPNDTNSSSTEDSPKTFCLCRYKTTNRVCLLVLIIGCLSVTRFGEISPLGPTLKNLWQIFEGLFSVCPNFEPTLAN